MPSRSITSGSTVPPTPTGCRLAVCLCLGRLQIRWNKAGYGTMTPRWEAMPQLEDQLYSRLCGVPPAAVRRAVELSAEEAAQLAGLCDALQMKAG